MLRLVYDIETDGLLDKVSKVHCIVTRDADTGEVKRFLDVPLDSNDGMYGVWGPISGTVDDGVAHLLAADVRIGHNIVGYDEPVFRKLRPGLWASADPSRVLDTMTGARVAWPEEHLKVVDYARMNRRGAPPFPRKLVGRHSLEAWGTRLVNYKGQKPTDFSVLTPSMLEYCVKDTSVTLALFRVLEKRVLSGKLSWDAVKLEQEYSARLDQQMKRGFAFDVPAAERLTSKLQAARARMLPLIAAAFPPFTIEYVTPKKRLVRTKIVPFNPNSQVHIAKALMERHGWKPTVFTEGLGRPQINKDILMEVRSNPGVQLLIGYMVLSKRLSQLAEGKTAWLKLVKPDGRIYGRINHNAAVTSRATHSRPNMSAVPTRPKPFWRACRALFIAPPGYNLVGGDASGLELRMLAHHLARYDGGAYARLVAEGDVHEANRRAAGIDTRERAKRFIYAWLYGAGDGKLALVLNCSRQQAKRARLQFLKNMPAVAQLKQDILRALKRNRGTLRALDGRHLHVRSEHSALNTLLQGNGAIVMKKACVLYHQWLETPEFFTDWGQVSQSHDEFQVEVKRALPRYGSGNWGGEEYAKRVGLYITRAIEEAGRSFNLRCPLAGEYKVGTNWSQTH